MRWPLKRLSDVCTRITDGTHQPPKFEAHGIPFLFVSNIVGGRISFETSKFISTETHAELTRRCPIEAGDILYTTVGSYGNPAVVRDSRPFSFQRHIAHLKPERRQVLPDYLGLALRSDFVRKQVDRVVRGVAQKTLNLAQLRSVEIPLPPLAEQRRIAEVLDRAAALRAKRRAALAQLDSLTQSVFLELFGAPCTRRNMWPSTSLGEAVEIVTGYPFRSAEYVTNGDSIRLCRGANILPGRLDWGDLARWPNSKKAEFSAFSLLEGDVIVAMDRPWISEGFKIALVQAEDCPSLLVQRVARLRGGKKLLNEFLFHLLNQPAFTRHCRPTETTVPHISPKDIRSFVFSFPPLTLQQEFARHVTAVEKLKATQRASLGELDALFASLQHRAFRGEL